MVVETFRRKIIRSFPSVDLAELRTSCFHPFIAGSCSQRSASFALLVGVVQDVNMAVAFLVFSTGILNCHPIAVSLRIKRGHIDFGFALHHHLSKVMARSASGSDSE